MIKFDGQAVRLGAYRDDEHFKDIAITEDPDIKRMLLKELTNRRWQKLISD